MRQIKSLSPRFQRLPLSRFHCSAKCLICPGVFAVLSPNIVVDCEDFWSAAVCEAPAAAVQSFACAAALPRCDSALKVRGDVLLPKEVACATTAQSHQGRSWRTESDNCEQQPRRICPTNSPTTSSSATARRTGRLCATWPLRLRPVPSHPRGDANSIINAMRVECAAQVASDSSSGVHVPKCKPIRKCLKSRALANSKIPN